MMGAKSAVAHVQLSKLERSTMPPASSTVLVERLAREVLRKLRLVSLKTNDLQRTASPHHSQNAHPDQEPVPVSLQWIS